MRKLIILIILFTMISGCRLNSSSVLENSSLPIELTSTIEPPILTATPTTITTDTPIATYTPTPLKIQPSPLVISKDQNSEPIVQTSDKAIDYLLSTVPEIDEFQSNMIKLNPNFKLMIRTDSEPDPNPNDQIERNYYSFYVGEDQSDHTVRWNSFLVNKDLNQILVEDIISGDNITLDDWRETIKENQVISVSDVQKIFDLNEINLTETEFLKNDVIFFSFHDEKITLYNSSLGKIYIIYFNTIEDRQAGEKKLGNMKSVGVNLDEYKKYDIKNILLISNSKNSLDDFVKKIQ